jgi:diguanylate cyclase (GGDEF)-like protein/PAS domain S-box-containing protein
MNSGKTSARRDALAWLATALDALHFGVLAVDANGQIAICNPAARRLLALSDMQFGQSVSISELTTQLADATIEPDEDGSTVTVHTAAGLVLQIKTMRLADGGAVLTIENVTLAHERNRARQFAEAEYFHLFSNSVCGIYRDQLDGTPVRCNPALAFLNGYDSEEEYITAVTEAHGAWYVDPSRHDEFTRLMREEGRVKDLVSEVYRHCTRERIWITENAWFVRDPEGNPLFIEGTIQDATERIATLSVIERQVNFDGLTSAASRFRFFGELEKSAEARTLFCIDLDRFKDVNDALGHGAGDAVLKIAAERLLALCDDSGMVARLGGDEFAMLLWGSDNASKAHDIAQSIVDALAEPMLIMGRSLVLGGSVGVASSELPHDSAEDLLRMADLALYEAKAAGRNCYRTFDYELRQRLVERAQIVAELDNAIRRHEFELYYQPIVRAPAGEITSFEALLRWNHPERGLLLPADFLPNAEAAGLMDEIGSWVIERVCADGAALPSGIRLNLNVSPNQFRSSALTDSLRRSLAASGFAASRLVLEITESAILPNETAAAAVLRDLDELGVSVALDDFGTSYSSLSYLQRFHFSMVKIDRSFVIRLLDDPTSAAIVRAILGIGRDLGIEVVAEGVETGELARALTEQGCSRMQGFYFGTPQSLADTASDLAVSCLANRLTEARDFGERLAIALSA